MYVVPIYQSVFTEYVLSKSHAKTVWGRSPNFLCMGFTFLMDANTSKYHYNFFMEVKETIISH